MKNLILLILFFRFVEAGVGIGYSSIGILSSLTTSVKSEDIVDNFEILQNYPNPFNPTTTIQVNIPENSNVSVNIYDLLGTKIKTLYDGSINSGKYLMVWDGTNYQGLKVSSGIYIYQLRSSEINIIKKMQIVK